MKDQIPPFTTLDAARAAPYLAHHLLCLFSGGHDSLVSTHIGMTNGASAVLHLNTGIGIEETRAFVRDTCQKHGWPLLERTPSGRTYEELVLADGFPGGPKAHNTMYYWLKQKQLRQVVQEYKRHRLDRVGLITGIRRSESVRRMGSGLAVPIRREGAIVWVCPILDWHASDINHYMSEHDLERSLVVDLLHRSGECLCGALARAREIHDIETWFPRVAESIHALEHEVTHLGLAENVWGGRLRRSRQQLRLPLCSDCGLEISP